MRPRMRHPRPGRSSSTCSGRRWKSFVKAGDFDSFICACYERFRRRFIECARNPVAAQMLDSIYEKTNVVIRRIVILPGRAQTGLE